MQLRRILMPCVALVALALPAVAAPDEAAAGQERRLSDRHPRQLVLRRKRPGRIVQPPRQAVAAQHPQEGGNAAAASRGRQPTEDRIPVRNRTLALDDFLARQRVTGLLLIKDGEVLVERYQYDRTPAHRFVSHSMAKSIVSIAVGMALAEGKIASLDDTVAKYVPKLAGIPYGETSIRNVLRMSSGVAVQGSL